MSESIDKYLEQLQLSHHLRRDVISKIIDTLNLDPLSIGLDAGCGSGEVSIMLAQRLKTGKVMGVDIEPHFLQYAKALTSEMGYSAKVKFYNSSIAAMPFEDETFDWTWSMDCVGYATSYFEDWMKEILRVMKPSGQIFLVAWSSQQLLPGYPELEAKLNATSSGISPFLATMSSDQHFFRLKNRLECLGLNSITTETFVGSINSPMSPNIHRALGSLIAMRWPNITSELSISDWELFQTLTDPNSDDFILNLTDYYGFFTYTMFRAKC